MIGLARRPDWCIAAGNTLYRSVCDAVLPLEYYVRGATDCFGAILQEPSSDGSWPVNAHPETAHRSEKPTISVAQLSLMRRELRFFNFKIANSTPQTPCLAQQWIALRFFIRQSADFVNGWVSPLPSA